MKDRLDWGSIPHSSTDERTTKYYMTDIERLRSLIRTMRLPRFRKDNLDNKHGLLWLARNMGMKNSKHLKYPEAVEQLKIMLREKLYNS